jgi:hypothetical protein
MAMKLGEAGHDLLDEFLEHILERYRSGTIDLIEARVDFARAFSLALSDSPALTAFMQSVVARDRS